MALDIASELGIPACAGHELSGLYGLELRTVTAAINASILPTALRTATSVERTVLQASARRVARRDARRRRSGGDLDDATPSAADGVQRSGGVGRRCAAPSVPRRRDRRRGRRDAHERERRARRTSDPVVRARARPRDVGAQPRRPRARHRRREHAARVRPGRRARARRRRPALGAHRRPRVRVLHGRRRPRKARVAELVVAVSGRSAGVRRAPDARRTPRRAHAHVRRERARTSRRPRVREGRSGRRARRVRSARTSPRRGLVARSPNRRSTRAPGRSPTSSRSSSSSTSSPTPRSSGSAAARPRSSVTSPARLGVEHEIPEHAEVISSVGSALSLIRVEIERSATDVTPRDAVPHGDRGRRRRRRRGGRAAVPSRRDRGDPRTPDGPRRRARLDRRRRGAPDRSTTTRCTRSPSASSASTTPLASDRRPTTWCSARVPDDAPPVRARRPARHGRDDGRRARARRRR